MSRKWRVAVAVSGLMLLGCAASEEEIQRRFEEYVSGANSCMAATECGVAAAGCPLGCEVAVRTERVADVEAKAQQLISEYERGGRSCIYGCRARGPVVCMNNRCAIQYDGAPDAGP